MSENRQFKFIKGPVFLDIILADEINRTPKTQHLQAQSENGPLPLQVKIISWTPYFVLDSKPY
jgi:MoxR-like ATPase